MNKASVRLAPSLKAPPFFLHRFSLLAAINTLSLWIVDVAWRTGFIVNGIRSRNSTKHASCIGACEKCP